MTQHLRRALAVSLIVTLVLVVLGYLAYREFKKLTASPPPPPGCQVGGLNGLDLSFGQAGIAATIAGVARRMKLPERAVTIAYATALQESDLSNLGYGDRDSLGVFQQRPSQGWGTAAEIRNPVYATTRFFEALVKVPHYTTLPVWRAAQDVQHSADGQAYQQYADFGASLAGAFTGVSAREVTCWYYPSSGTREPALTGSAATGLAAAFSGTVASTERAGVLEVTPEGTGTAQRVSTGWAAASWLVSNAQRYRITTVRYAGYQWTAASGGGGWRRSTGTQADSRQVPGTVTAR